MPDLRLRQHLFRQCIPAGVPLHTDVDLDELADRYKFSGGDVRNAVYRAAATAALREEGERVVEQADLLAACEVEKTKARGAMYEAMQNQYL